MNKYIYKKAIEEYSLCKYCMIKHEDECPDNIKFEDLTMVEISCNNESNKEIVLIKPSEKDYHCYNFWYGRLRKKAHFCSKYPHCDLSKNENVKNPSLWD